MKGAGRWTAAEMRERKRSMPVAPKPRERQRPPDPANPVSTVKRDHHGTLKLLTREALDMRTRPALLFNRIVAAIHADLNGREELSQIELSLADAFALAYVQLDNLAARTLLGQAVDPAAVAQCTNSMVRVGGRLGLRRRQRDVTPPDLQQYLNTRARQVNGNDAVDTDEYAEDD